MSTFDDIFTMLLAAVIIIVGLGLGADSTIDDFKSALKLPKAVLCGFACQYGFMPLCAFAFVRMAKLPEYTAIGVILTGSSPGGTTSNLFTHWSRGDVPLSITMSFLSTLAAMFMLPLLIVVYIKALSDAKVLIPWTNIIISTLLIAFPTSLGIWIRRSNVSMKVRDKFIWEWIRDSTTIFGGMFVLAALASGIILHWKEMASARWELWLFAFIMEPLGCLFGFMASKLLALPPRSHPTIALECGVQNFTFTMVVVNLSFGSGTKEADAAFLFPVMYGIAYCINSLWIVLLLRNALPYTLPDSESKEAQVDLRDQAKMFEDEGL
jgi:bile acid:Na+ symporter, BASS family